MFEQLTEAEQEELYEMYGREEDEKVRQLEAEFGTTQGIVELWSIMTGVSKMVATGNMLPLVLIDDSHEYTIKQNCIIVKECWPVNVEVCRMGVGVARDFFTSRSYLPVGDTYVLNKVKPTQERVPLPPSRRDASVTGQLKLMVDVALSLPYVKKTDVVCVLGSANTFGTAAAESYRLLEGKVQTLILEDPFQPHVNENVNGTRVIGIPQEHPLTERVICDVYFNDASNSVNGKLKNVVVPFTARYFSLKCAGLKPEQLKVARSYKASGYKFYTYTQISDTYEKRLTSEPRYFQNYVHRLGTCAACVEIDYHLPENFFFDDYQYRVIRDIHAYGQVHCTMARQSRPVSQTLVNTLVMRTMVVPLYLTTDVMEARGEGVPYHIGEREKIVNPMDLQGSALDVDNVRYFFTLEKDECMKAEEVVAPLQLHQVIDYKFVRQSVVFIDLGERPRRLNEIFKTWYGLLVVDTYVYEFDYSMDGTGDLCVGMFPTRCPVTKWWVSRFGTILQRGLTAASLAAAVTVLLRNHQYRKFGLF